MGVMPWSACLFVGSVAVGGYGFLFGCTTVGWALGLVTALAWGFDLLVGAWCLSLAWPARALLGVFFDSCCWPFSLCRLDVLI